MQAQGRESEATTRSKFISHFVLALHSQGIPFNRKCHFKPHITRALITARIFEEIFKEEVKLMRKFILWHRTFSHPYELIFCTLASTRQHLIPELSTPV
uniref:Uncharacterized protein n=1 Tax=Echinococcus canadensis TaxID=519352 RepID=A0A915F038_9CEST